MKFVDEYRQGQLIRSLVLDIRRSCTRRWVIMDVCGGQTHALLRHGLEEELEDVVELIHGPGCPVCVTPAHVIDTAIELAKDKGVILASFGDMIRVPGTRGSLINAKAHGGDVRTVYSPIDALRLAEKNPRREVVFFGVGFETTVPATALAILQARRLNIANFSTLIHHVRVEPAMRSIMRLPENRVQAFLAAGHVCTVTGFSHYEQFVHEFRVPVVVTGFEPVDLLLGIAECVKQLESGTPQLCNAYSRSASPAGNARARDVIDQVYSIASLPWRGFGTIQDGGLQLKPEFARYSAAQRFCLTERNDDGETECQSAAIMSGQMKPSTCPHFGKKCTPESPLGAPMVSDEGTCAAYFRYAIKSQKEDHD